MGEKRTIHIKAIMGVSQDGKEYRLVASNEASTDRQLAELLRELSWVVHPDEATCVVEFNVEVGFPTARVVGSGDDDFEKLIR